MAGDVWKRWRHAGLGVDLQRLLVYEPYISHSEILLLERPVNSATITVNAGLSF